MWWNGVSCCWLKGKWHVEFADGHFPNWQKVVMNNFSAFLSSPHSKISGANVDLPHHCVTTDFGEEECYGDSESPFEVWFHDMIWWLVSRLIFSSYSSHFFLKWLVMTLKNLRRGIFIMFLRRGFVCALRERILCFSREESLPFQRGCVFCQMKGTLRLFSQLFFSYYATLLEGICM